MHDERIESPYALPSDRLFRGSAMERRRQLLLRPLSFTTTRDLVNVTMRRFCPWLPFPDRVRVVLPQPLKRHAHASQAAAAALAAVEFGKGEQFHQALIDLKVAPTDGQLQYLAAVAAIDPSLLQNAMERHTPLVEQDIRDALTLEARGTPHTFVNGRRVKGAVKRSTLRRSCRKNSSVRRECNERVD